MPLCLLKSSALLGLLCIWWSSVLSRCELHMWLLVAWFLSPPSSLIVLHASASWIAAAILEALSAQMSQSSVTSSGHRLMARPERSLVMSAAGSADNAACDPAGDITCDASWANGLVILPLFWLLAPSSLSLVA